MLIPSIMNETGLQTQRDESASLLFVIFVGFSLSIVILSKEPFLGFPAPCESSQDPGVMNLVVVAGWRIRIQF